MASAFYVDSSGVGSLTSAFRIPVSASLVVDAEATGELNRPLFITRFLVDGSAGTALASQSRVAAPTSFTITGLVDSNLISATNVTKFRTYSELSAHLPAVALSVTCPQLLWNGFESDGTNISIPLDQLPGLTAEKANATTGDWRKILRALLISAQQYETIFEPGSVLTAYHSWMITAVKPHAILTGVARQRFYTTITLAQIDDTTLKEEP